MILCFRCRDADGRMYKPHVKKSDYYGTWNGWIDNKRLSWTGHVRISGCSDCKEENVQVIHISEEEYKRGKHDPDEPSTENDSRP